MAICFVDDGLDMPSNIYAVPNGPSDSNASQTVLTESIQYAKRHTKCTFTYFETFNKWSNQTILEKEKLMRRRGGCFCEEN